MAGPDIRFPAEFVDTLVHVKGALAAARLGGPINPQKKSSGSQFYIVQGRKLDNSTNRISRGSKKQVFFAGPKREVKRVGRYTSFG